MAPDSASASPPPSDGSAADSLLTPGAGQSNTPRPARPGHPLLDALIALLALLTLFNPYVVSELFTTQVWFTPGIATACHLAVITLLAALVALLWHRHARRGTLARARAFFPTITLLATITLFFCTAEVFLRLVVPAPQTPTTSVPKAYTYGWVPGHPRRSLTMSNPDTGELSTDRLNAAGWRDVDHLTGHTSIPRILLLGDSQLFGKGVPLDETIHRQLQLLLADSAEVISIACPGWSTDHQLVALETEGLAYGPDAVIVVFTVANDVADNATQREAFAGAQKPYFTLADNELVPHPLDRRPSIFKVAGDNSRVALHIRYALNNALSRTQQRKRSGRRPDYLYVNWRAFTTNEDDRLMPGWKMTEALLDRMNRICADRHIHFAVYPYGEHLTVELEPRDPRDHDSPILDRSLPYRRLRDIAARRGISLVPESEETRRRHQSGELKFATDVHFNALGCREAAKVLAAYIHPLLAKPPPALATNTTTETWPTTLTNSP